jgi:hypothetical protein
VHDDRQLPADRLHRKAPGQADREDRRHEAGAATRQPHRGVRDREARHEVHAQHVEVTAERRLGRVHRHAGRAEEHDQTGVRRPEPRHQVGPGGDRQARRDEAEVAERVDRLPDPSGGRLAEVGAPVDIRTEPAEPDAERQQRQ